MKPPAGGFGHEGNLPVFHSFGPVKRQHYYNIFYINILYIYIATEVCPEYPLRCLYIFLLKIPGATPGLCFYPTPYPAHEPVRFGIWPYP